MRIRSKCLTDCFVVNQQLLLIQGALLSTWENDKLARNSKDASLAEGHVFASALMPYIHDVDIKAGVTIMSNLAFDLDGIPVQDGRDEVFNAFKFAIDKMNDINCRDIGSLEGRQFCLLTSSGASNFSLNAWIVVCATILLGLQVNV